MKEYTLSQKYALVGLDGMSSTQWDMLRSATARGLAAAKLLEKIAPVEEETDRKTFESELTQGVLRIRHQKKRKGLAVEEEMVTLLEADGSLDRVPDILACDVFYQTSGIGMMVYRSDASEYLRITESIRAEVLEEGPMTWECICMLWLLRESGCLYELFSVEEQRKVDARMVEACAYNDIYRILWQSEFYNKWEDMVRRFKRNKKEFFKNHPTMQGVNLVFPFLERRSAIFIDYVILGTTVGSRRLAMMNFLTEQGHLVEEVKSGNETLLKIDNMFYRIFPRTLSVQGIPIQGANLVPVYR